MAPRKSQKYSPKIHFCCKSMIHDMKYRVNVLQKKKRQNKLLKKIILYNVKNFPRYEKCDEKSQNTPRFSHFTRQLPKVKE
jgi:hypothetical protein